MRKIAIINQKGGSGKTTTAVNLAASLAEKRRRILLIDLDAQAATTRWYGIGKNTKGIYSIFTESANIADLIITTSLKKVDIVPASSWLVGLDKRLSQEVGAETILKHQMETLAPDAYHYILIDCPPTLGILTVNALCAVDEVIIPVEARFMALNGVVQLLETIEVIKQRLNPQLKISGIVPCRVDARTKHSKEVVSDLQNNFQGMVFKTAIRENVRLSEAPSFSKSILDYDKHSNGAFDYRALAKEVIKQERK